MSIAETQAHLTEVPVKPEEPIPHRITSARYQKMIEAGVFLDGEPIFLWDGTLVEEMTKGNEHNFASDSLNRLLGRLLPDGWFLRVEKPVTLQEDYTPEPDLMVARGNLRDYVHRETVPEDIALCIEVADSSLLFDLRKKLPVYARVGFPAYWLVNIPHRRLEVYEGPEGSTFRTRRDYGPGDEVPVVLDGREVGRIAASEFLP